MGRQCGNDNRKALIVCPFYHRFFPNGNTIVCEGMEDSSELCMSFPRREDMDRHLQCACNSYDFELRCPIAKILMGAWQDPDLVTKAD